MEIMIAAVMIGLMLALLAGAAAEFEHQARSRQHALQHGQDGVAVAGGGG